MAGRARAVLPFLFIGGGGGRGPDLPGGSLTGGGGLSLGGGGRGPERPGEGNGGAEDVRDRFRCGSLGISSLEAGGRGGGPGRLGGGGGGGACEPNPGRGVEGTGGLLVCEGGGGTASLCMEGLLPTGGGGGGGLSSKARLGVGGKGGLGNGEEEPEGFWRAEPAPKAAPRFPGKGGLGAPSPAGDPRLCRLDGTGLGVFGTGGGRLSGFEPTSGLGGGILFLGGSGGPLLWPGEGAGNLPGPLGGEKGLADVALPPGGKIGGRLPPESKEQESGYGLKSEEPPKTQRARVRAGPFPLSTDYQ